jgi:hypothetical protein
MEEGGMEEVVAQCPECGQRMRAPIAALGKRGACIACGHRFAIRPLAFDQVSCRSDLEEAADEADLWGSDPGDEIRKGPKESALASFLSPQDAEPIGAGPPQGVADTVERFLKLNADCPAQALPVQPGDSNLCPRCKRLYRGIWDREETSEGIMCHRCANLIVGHEPSVITRDAAAKVREHPAGSPAPEAEAALPFHERYRGQLIYFGVSLFLLALIAVLPVERWIGAALYGQVADAEPTMHPEWNRLFAVLSFVLGLAGYYIALHMTLQAAGRFEGWDWKETVPYVLKGALIVYLWMVVLIMVSWYPLVGMLLFGMGAVLIPLILWSIYELSVSEFLILAFFLSLTHPLLWALGHLIYGILAFIIT